MQLARQVTRLGRETSGAEPELPSRTILCSAYRNFAYTSFFTSRIVSETPLPSPKTLIYFPSGSRHRIPSCCGDRYLRRLVGTSNHLSFDTTDVLCEARRISSIHILLGSRDQPALLLSQRANSPQSTIATAQVLLHRFFYVSSMVSFGVLVSSPLCSFGFLHSAFSFLFFSFCLRPFGFWIGSLHEKIPRIREKCLVRVRCIDREQGCLFFFSRNRTEHPHVGNARIGSLFLNLVRWLSLHFLVYGR